MCSPDPGGGNTRSRTSWGVLFQIFWTMAFNSVLQESMEPSILIRRDVRITANRVAVKVTVPSGLRGMFMATNRSVCTFVQKKLKRGAKGEVVAKRKIAVNRFSG